MRKTTVMPACWWGPDSGSWAEGGWETSTGVCGEGEARLGLASLLSLVAEWALIVVTAWVLTINHTLRLCWLLPDWARNAVRLKFEVVDWALTWVMNRDPTSISGWSLILIIRWALNPGSSGPWSMFSHRPLLLRWGGGRVRGWGGVSARCQRKTPNHRCQSLPKPQNS